MSGTKYLVQAEIENLYQRNRLSYWTTYADGWQKNVLT